MTDYGKTITVIKSLIKADRVVHLHVGMKKDVKIELKSGRMLTYHGELGRKIAKYILFQNC